MLSLYIKSIEEIYNYKLHYFTINAIIGSLFLLRKKVQAWKEIY